MFQVAPAFFLPLDDCPGIWFPGLAVQASGIAGYNQTFVFYLFFKDFFYYEKNISAKQAQEIKKTRVFEKNVHRSRAAYCERQKGKGAEKTVCLKKGFDVWVIHSPRHTGS